MPYGAVSRSCLVLRRVLEAPGWSPRTTNRLVLGGRLERCHAAAGHAAGSRGRLAPWTSALPTPTASPASRPARCRSRVADPARQRRRACSSRRGPATTTASRSRSSPSCASPATPSTTCSCRTSLLDAVEAALARIVEGSRDLRPVLVVGAPLRRRQPALQLRGRDPPRPDPRRGAEVVPADLPRVLRAAALRARRRPARRDLAVGGAAGAVRHRPALPRRPTCPGLVLHVEVCEDMWVPVPPSAEAALAGATVLANLSGSPITVARAEDRRLLVRSASARCLAAYLYAAAGQGESTTDLSWDGQTMVYECGELLGETERFPDGPRRTVADVDLDRLRQERLRQGTFDDNRRTGLDSRPGRDFRTRRASPSTRPPATSGCAARSTGSRSCPTTPERLRPGLLRGLQHPGLRARAAAARDRPAEGRDRRLRRAGLHARADRRGQGDGPAGPAAQRHPRLHDAGLRDRRGDQGQRHPAVQGARGHLRGARHPPGRAADARRPGPPVRRRRAGLRRHLRERPGRAAHRLPVPDRQPARRHRARHRRPVRAGARLVHLRRRRPDVALHRQLRRAEDADPAPDPLGGLATGSSTPRTSTRCCRRSSSRRSPPSWCPRRRASSRSRTEETIGPYALQDFTLFHVLRYGFRPSKIAFLAEHAWSDPKRGSGRRGSPRTAARRTTWPTIRHWLEVFIKRFFAFSQFKRSALPNGPKVVRGRRRCRRAATGGHRPTATPGPGWPSWSATCRRRDVHLAVTRVRHSGPMGKQEEFVLRALEERDVRFVRLWFTDVLGYLKSVAVAPAELEGAFAEGIGFDGSAIEGFARVYEADMLAKPDPSTFQILPWRGERPGNGADVLRHRDAGRLPVVRRPAVRAQAHPVAGGRARLHLLHAPRDRVLPVQGHPAARATTRCRSTAAATSTTPRRAPGSDFRREAITMLESMGISVEFSHHEGGPGPAGDRPALRRRAVDRRQHHDLPHRRAGGGAGQGIWATFMPKPFTTHPGSGMHTHVSLFEGDRNAFFEAGAEYQLSKTGRQFIAGILRHAARDHRGHQPVGELLQAADRRRRGAVVHLLGAQQPLGDGAGADVQAATRASRPGSSCARSTRRATPTSRSRWSSPPA